MAEQLTNQQRREGARRAYLAGRFGEAIEAQRQIVKTPVDQSDATLADHLTLALYHHAADDHAGRLDVLQNAEPLFPEEPLVLENLGITLLMLDRLEDAQEKLKAAVSLGSESFNVFDALALCRGRLGDEPAAKQHGERSLQIKDEFACSSGSAYAIPDAPPPTFDPAAIPGNVIGFSFWGNDQRYLAGALHNAKLAPDIYPGWRCRFYVDDTVPEDTLSELSLHGCDIVRVERPNMVFGGLFWRFHVACDPDIKRFLVRDADSVISVQERVAVDEWLASDRYFHIMRDHFSHTDLILAGLWGGVGGVFPPLTTLLAKHPPDRFITRNIDQDFLRLSVWPTVKQSCLIHDSLFTSFSARDYPPFGRLPVNRHIGQNESAVSQSVNVKIMVGRDGQQTELTIPIRVDTG